MNHPLAFNLTLVRIDGTPSLIVTTPDGFNPADSSHVMALSDQDYELWARLSAMLDGFGKPIAEITERIVYYGMNPGGCEEVQIALMSESEMAEAVGAQS